MSGNLEKCRSLSVEGGLDPSMLSIIYSKDRDEWSPLPSTSPLVIRVDPDQGPIRFIQVYLQESVEFELDTINVAAPTFDATIPSQLF
jgi:hypothetical protein